MPGVISGRRKSVVIVLLGLIVSTTSGVGAETAPTRSEVAKESDDKETSINLIILGALACAPCRTPEMKQAFRDARGIFAKLAEKEHSTFAVTVAAWDASVADGLKYVSELESCDEIVVGRGWKNSAFTRYIGEYPDAVSGIPQLIVVRQRFRLNDGKVHLVSEKILARSLGTFIPQWIKNGAPF